MKENTSAGLKAATVAIVMVLVTLLSPSRGDAFCFEEAGNMYGVSPGLLWAIAKVESDFDPGALKHNADGSYDYGVMQINSRWKGKLGPRLWDSLGDPCTNVKVGSRILSDCIKRYGYNWEGIGCYNAISQNKRADYARAVNGVILQMQKAAAAVSTN